MKKLKVKEKLTNFFKNFKTIWSNKRYKSLIILGLWILFFAIVVLIVRIQSDKIKQYNDQQPVILSINEILENINSYSFTYQIQNDDETIIIDGTNYNEEFVVTLKEKRYYINDYVYLINGEKLVKQENPFEINFNVFNIQKIYNLIKNRNPLYEIKENNMTTSIYKVLLYEINEEMADETMEISITKSEDKIQNILLDLTQYINCEQLRYKKFTLSIVIDDINDISKFDYNVEE